MTPDLPSEEQQWRARWLADLEQRIEQVRRLKPIEGPRLVILAVTIAATVFAAGAVVGGLIVWLLSGNGS